MSPFVRIEITEATNKLLSQSVEEDDQRYEGQSPESWGDQRHRKGPNQLIQEAFYGGTAILRVGPTYDQTLWFRSFSVLSHVILCFEFDMVSFITTPKYQSWAWFSGP